MHSAMLHACPHCSVLHLQQQGQPVANTVQGYRLGMPSTDHASQAGATRNKKYFSGPLRYKQTDKQTNKIIALNAATVQILLIF